MNEHEDPANSDVAEYQEIEQRLLHTQHEDRALEQITSALGLPSATSASEIVGAVKFLVADRRPPPDPALLKCRQALAWVYEYAGLRKEAMPENVEKAWPMIRGRLKAKGGSHG